MKSWLTTALTLSLILSTPFANADIAQNVEMPDARIKEVAFDSNQIVPLILNYGIATTIQFGEGETALDVAFGDPAAWQVTKLGNSINIKPVKLDAATNLTVWTNQRMYLFDLKVNVPSFDDNGQLQKSMKGDELYLVRFIYDDKTTTRLEDFIQTDKFEPTCTNKHYSRYGDKDIAPIFICDDGRFIYMKYRPLQDLPAVFYADIKGKEQTVNSRQVGRYQIIERLGRQFTLRYGDSVATIFNEHPQQ